MKNIDCNEQKDVNEIHNNMLKEYEKYMNKGIYKYSINKGEHNEDVRVLMDMLGNDEQYD